MVTVLPAWVWGPLFRSGSHTSEIAFSPRRCSKNQNSERHYWREYDFILHCSSRRMQKARLAHTPSAKMQISCNLNHRTLTGFRSYYINVEFSQSCSTNHMNPQTCDSTRFCEFETPVDAQVGPLEPKS